jgi:hypothetical protein
MVGYIVYFLPGMMGMVDLPTEMPRGRDCLRSNALQIIKGTQQM